VCVQGAKHVLYCIPLLYFYNLSVLCVFCYLSEYQYLYAGYQATLYSSIGIQTEYYVSMLIRRFDATLHRQREVIQTDGSIC